MSPFLVRVRVCRTRFAVAETDSPDCGERNEQLARDLLPLPGASGRRVRDASTAVERQVIVTPPSTILFVVIGLILSKL